MEPSGVNLSDLLRITFSEPIKWLVSSQDADTAIQWFSVTFEDWQPGDILLLPASSFDDKRFKQAQKRGIPVVLLVGPQPPDISTANSGETIILFIETDADLRTIQRSLARSLTNKQAVSLERGLSIHDQLTKLAADGVQIEGVVRAMHEITGRGILIQDKRLSTITECASPELQSIWVDVIDQLSELEYLPATLRDRSQTGQQSLVLQPSIAGGISRIVAPIVVGSVTRGFLSVIGMEGELDTLDQIVAVEGALICAVEMSHAKAIRETEKRLQSDLLTALLQEDLSPRDASLWIEAMGLDQSQAHAALQFAWDSDSPPSRRRLETLINGEVVRLGIKVILNPAGENVICFCQVPFGNERPWIALELAKNVVAQAQIEFPQTKIRCGVGIPVVDLNQWHTSFRNAGHALEMAFRLDEEKPLYYPDLSVYRLLMLIEHNPELRSFQEDILGTLLLNEGNNAFIQTLEAYFESNGNLSRAAETLFIHRNTLSYRLEKIAEISGLDVNNPDTALAIQLALKIHRMMGAKMQRDE